MIRPRTLAALLLLLALAMLLFLLALAAPSLGHAATTPALTGGNKQIEIADARHAENRTVPAPA